MNLELQEAQASSLEKPQNPIIWDTTEAFQEKAFCIVGDEMKAKMDALGLTEEDLIKIFSCENDIDEYLELIDIYFEEVKNLKDAIFQKIKDENEQYSNGEMPDKEIYNAKATNDQFWDYLTWFRSLNILFSNYPWKIKEIFGKSYFTDLMHLLRYSSTWEQYQFDWALAIQAFELWEETERNRKWWEERYDIFDLLCDVCGNLYEVIKEPQLFNDVLKLSIAAWRDNIAFLLKTLKKLSPNEIENIRKNYEIFIKLWIVAWKNNTQFFQFWWRKLSFLNSKQRDLIILWLEKLWPDFIYVYDHNSLFIHQIIERFPDRYVEFCEKLKKLADYSGNSDTFYNRCLTGITEFVVENPDKWDYLLKIWEIFGKSIPWIFSIWKSFINELLKYFPNDYEEILLEVKDEWDHIKGWNEWYFLTYWLKFLAKFLDEWKEKFFEALSELKKLNDEELKQNHNTWEVFFEHGLDFATKYMIYFPDSWPEIWKKVVKTINACINKIPERKGSFKQFMSWFDNFIIPQIIDEDPRILDELLDFLNKIWGSKDALKIVSGLKDITFDLPDDDEYHDYKALKNKNKLDKNSISFTLAHLLKHKKSRIIPFINNLQLIKDLNLEIDINVVLDWEIDDEKLKSFEKLVKKHLKTKKSFKNDKSNATYHTIVQEVFWERINKKIKWFNVVPEVQRKRNIEKVNWRQKVLLKSLWIKSVAQYNVSHRTLVLYFREENMDSFHFSFITHIIQSYIAWWYSELFDRVLVTSRGNWKYPHEIHELWEIPYQFHDFKMVTNIFANTVHFTHGTVIEEDYMKTTTHIIWIANLADTDDEKNIRVPKNWNYVPLYLKYWKTHWEYIPEYEVLDRSSDFDSVFDEVIRAIRTCEEMMIAGIIK